MKIDPELLRILVCPACRVAVRPSSGSGLECDDCGRVYPLRDGTPVMLLEEAAVEESPGGE